MKTRLLIALAFITFSLSAQTTHNLDWFAGMGTNVDLTITSGDTVIWTWTSPNHTVENTPGSSVETFNSGFLPNIGDTFEYTFNVVGLNDYFCGVHGAASMSGTITVEDNLGLDDELVNSFNMHPNPTNDFLSIKLKNGIQNADINIYNVIGKLIINQQVVSDQITLINVSNLETGLYLIKISNGSNSETKRFIKN